MPDNGSTDRETDVGDPVGCRGTNLVILLPNDYYWLWVARQAEPHQLYSGDKKLSLHTILGAIVQMIKNSNSPSSPAS